MQEKRKEKKRSNQVHNSSTSSCLFRELVKVCRFLLATGIMTAGDVILSPQGAEFIYANFHN
jgi:hypothetical protein